MTTVRNGRADVLSQML